MKLFRPWVFQGSLTNKNYFEGWYYKHVSHDRRHALSFIPGISLSADPHAFVQVINGTTGSTQYFEYGLDQFAASTQRLDVRIGNSHFSDRGIKLDLHNEASKIQGELSFSELEPYPSTLINPGIMGWYSFVPLMECKHGIVSTSHRIDGGLTVDDEAVGFDSGTGYIEKDWGRSFPESWLWLHCNTFDNSKTSFTLSVAKIPWLGRFFIGFISYLKTERGFYNFSTWSRARVESLSYQGDELSVVIRNKHHLLKVTGHNNMPGRLKAPVSGSMKRIIKESVDARITLELLDNKGAQVFADTGSRAGMELIDEILAYFQ